MKLYNKSQRSFIVSRLDAISGCRIPTDEIGKDKAYIDPEKTVEVKDVIGRELLASYPKELMELKADSKEDTESRKAKLKKKR